MPPTPQPSTPRPLIIVVCESVPTSVSGYSAPSFVEHDAREVLEVDLVDDARVRRHGLEALERGLAPAQERVALPVALELLLGVDAERLGGAERVDLDRVVDHELDRHERVDRGRVAAHVGHRVAQRGEVDDARHAGEVLQDHPRGRERDLLGRLGLGVPGRERLDVLAADADAVLVAQQVLEQHLQREGQPRHVVGRLQRFEAIDLVGAPADLELGARVEGILRAHGTVHVRRQAQWTSDGMPRARRSSRTPRSPRPARAPRRCRPAPRPAAPRTCPRARGRAGRGRDGARAAAPRGGRCRGTARCPLRSPSQRRGDRRVVQQRDPERAQRDRRAAPRRAPSASAIDSA